MLAAFVLQSQEMKQHHFYRENGGWYIDLPAYLEEGGSKGDLAMVAGANTMLEVMASDAIDVMLLIDEQPFEGADELLRTEVCEPSMGSGCYWMQHFERKRVAQSMWLCDVTNFVFGYLPNKIYVKRSGEGQ